MQAGSLENRMPEEEPIYIATAVLVQNLGNFANVKAEKINPHFPLAKKDTIAVIGTDKYTEMLAAEETDEDRAVIASGEAYFVLAYLVRALNNVSSGAGMTKSTGFDKGKTDNMSETDVQSLIEFYRGEAERTLQGFKKMLDTDEDGKDDVCNAGNVKMVAI